MAKKWFPSLGRKQHVKPELKRMVVNRLPNGDVDPTRRILLVFPVFSHFFPSAFGAFASALLHAGRYCTEYKFDVMYLERQLIHSAMNQAVETLVQNPFYDAMIAFDDDCIMPMNVIARLIAHYEHGNPIVAAYGFMRNYPHTTTVGRLIEDGMTLHHNGDPSSGQIKGFDWMDDITKLKTEADEHGLVDVDFCGMPAMMIARSVFLKMRNPPFGHHDVGGYSTHDIYFCNGAKDAGYQIKVDVTLECGHIGPQPIITSQTRAAARSFEPLLSQVEQA